MEKSNTALFTLCNHAKHVGKVASSLIKSIMKPVWPKKKEISIHITFNIPVKVTRFMPILHRTNGDYKDFKVVVNANDILNGIDNDVTLYDEKAYELAQSLWLEVMSSVWNKEEVISSSIKYLELVQGLASRDLSTSLQMLQVGRRKGC